MNLKKLLSGISLFAGIALCAAPPMIPGLNWEKRSDWVSVKTPKTWHGLVAGGDGKNDRYRRDSDDDRRREGKGRDRLPSAGAVPDPPTHF